MRLRKFKFLVVYCRKFDDLLKLLVTDFSDEILGDSRSWSMIEK